MHIPPNRIRGRPKYKWTEQGLLELWDLLKADKPEYQGQRFTPTDTTHVNELTLYAIANKDKTQYELINIY